MSWAQDQAPKDAANPFGRKYPARIYRTVRLQGPPPVIDGKLDDPAWSEGEWAGRLHAANAHRGGEAVGAHGAQDPLRRQVRLLRDPRVRRSCQGPPLPRPARRHHRRHRRRLLQQLQRQAHGVRVRPDGGRQQDRPHPGQRRDRVGHELGRRLGRGGGPRRDRLDGGGPRALQPVALRAAGRAGLGPPRLALDRSQPGRGPVAAHPAAEHGTHVQPGGAPRHPGAQALAPPRGAAPPGGQRGVGPRRRGRDRHLRHRGRRRQARGDDQLHPRRHRESGLRAGRGRSVGRQPHGLRDASTRRSARSSSRGRRY